MTSYSTGTEGWPAPVVIYVRDLFLFLLKLLDNRKMRLLRHRKEDRKEGR